MVVPVDIGLLVIRGSTDLVKQKLQRLLELAASKVKQKLYVHLEENDNFKELLPEIYLSAASLKSGIDFRVLLDRRTVNVDKVFYDEIKDPDHPTFPIFNEDSCINKKPFSLNKTSAFSNSLEKPYDHVIMGGAFDRLHNGHKLLLSEAVLLSKKITCGVTNGEMIKKKILYELMEPVTTRCAEVENFVNDVSENVKCITVPIFDAFGPSIEDKGYEAIIVSEETLVGGEAVNIKRKERGLFPLKIHIIKLLGNERLNDRILNETKLSSSANRRELLGKILIEPTPPIEPISTKHYLIGLTGGIASGKTHIAKYLASQGCEVIECDTLVHKLYSESEELRNKLADVFGSSILTDERNIDRKKLGEVVFGDKQKLQLLNNLVWPITFERVKEIVKKSEKEIVIIDAALLLEAGWAKYLNQVWCTFVPRQEAIERICARDGVSKENAIERLDNQLENSERIAKSNVVFCSLWEYAETERQVSKTLELIRNYYLPKTIY